MGVGTVLTASHLTRRFESRVAVDDVSFELVPGEVFALLGPNGAGKTTTLRMLGGIIAPTSGEVRIGDEVVSSRTAPHLRQRVGFLTEAPGLWDRLTVGRNLFVYARLYDLPNPSRSVDEALDLFDLRPRRDERAAVLSKGLKQRVALARALLHKPDVVLLDEPTAGLDPESAREVRDLILRLRDERRTVLISTHNLDEVQRIANRVAVLRRRLLALDSPGALRASLFGARVVVTLAQPAEPFAAPLRASFDDVVVSERTMSIGVSDAETHAPAIVRALVHGGADVVAVTAADPPLEDVYLRLVDGDEA
jgi:ABC-2 type transport system ATP-binding protein